MTVSPTSLPELFKGVQFIHSLGLRVKSNLAYGPDWSGDNTLKIFKQQLKMLIDYYVENSDIEPTTLVNMDLIPIAYPKEGIHKWCGMGGQMAAYDIYGNKVPYSLSKKSTPNKKGVDFFYEIW